MNSLAAAGTVRLPSSLASAVRNGAMPAYRADIDGLRAVAVLAVVAFHFFPTALPGGFVGVDIFFVISGYLISRIIMGELETGSFRFADFYGRRVRRIFPALCLVMTATLAFGWTALLGAEYAQLGRHAAAGAGFVANLVLWSEAGYFDRAAIAKPLMHLWSLGVEEQFYIFWPVFVWLAWKRRFSLLVVACALALLSFGANLATVLRDGVAAFYSPFTRFWELMVGALLAYVAVSPSSKFRNLPPALASIVSATGAALIALGILFVREKNFPGWQALIPTAGAALLILAGPGALLNRALLSRRPMVAVGVISFPLYLWHWPLLSLTRIVHGEPETATSVTLMVTSIGLATLTYWLVERPVKQVRDRGSMTLVLTVLMATVASAGWLAHARAGWEDRVAVQVNAPLQKALETHYPPYTRPCSPETERRKDLFECRIDGRSPPRFALLGDSKAGALFPGVIWTSAAGGTWMFLGSGTDRPLLPVLSESRTYAYVDRMAVESALRTISDTPSVETVVIAAAARALFALANNHSIADMPASKHYDAALAGLDASISRLLAAGKRVVLLVDNPTLPAMEDCIGRKTSVALFNQLLESPPHPDCRIPMTRHLELSRQYRDLLNALRARHPGQVAVFDTIPILCDEAGDVCAPSRGGPLLYGVTDHLSDHASRLVGRALNAQLQDTGPRDPHHGSPASAR